MWYREHGYFPETLLAYLTTIGGGCKTQAIENNTFFSDFANVHSNLVANFDETKISNRSVKLNPELLDNINQKFLKAMLTSFSYRRQIISDLRQLLK